MIGKTLAHYEIVALLGKGGVAEVYRARDTRLDRDVALKILPPRFTRDTDRSRRFESEARSACALNHPHLAHIYDVGEVCRGCSRGRTCTCRNWPRCRASSGWCG